MENKTTSNIVEKQPNNFINLESKIKDCNEQKIYKLFEVHFLTLFLDLQELNDFILYLYTEKKENYIKDILENFLNILKDFREKKKI